MNIQSANNMNNLSALLEAARQRNGMGGNGAAKKAEKSQPVSFLSMVERIGDNIGKVRSAPRAPRKVVPAVFPKINRPDNQTPKKALGNYIDLMA